MNIYVLTNKYWDGHKYWFEIEGFTETKEEAEKWIAMQNNTANDYYEYEEVMKI